MIRQERSQPNIRICEWFGVRSCIIRLEPNRLYRFALDDALLGASPRLWCICGILLVLTPHPLLQQCL